MEMTRDNIESGCNGHTKQGNPARGGFATMPRAVAKTKHGDIDGGGPVTIQKVVARPYKTREHRREGSASIPRAVAETKRGDIDRDGP